MYSVAFQLPTRLCNKNKKKALKKSKTRASVQSSSQTQMTRKIHFSQGSTTHFPKSFCTKCQTNATLYERRGKICFSSPVASPKIVGTFLGSIALPRVDLLILARVEIRAISRKKDKFSNLGEKRIQEF